MSNHLSEWSGNVMSNHLSDMTEVGTGMYRIDVGYGKIETVNAAVCNYIWRLRQELKKAGLSENPRHNVGA